MVMIGSHAIEGYCTGGRPLCFGARPWCDVRTVASNVQRHSRGTRTGASALAVFLGIGERCKLAARASLRTGCDRSAHYRVALHPRKASLIRRKAVVRRASCGFQRVAGIRVARVQAPLHWLSLEGWQNTQAYRARAPCHAACHRCTQYQRALHRRPATGLSLSAQDRGATYEL